MSHSVVLGLVLTLLALTLTASGCARNPQVAQKPLAPSQPAEKALRAMRLVGIEHASVGEQAGTAVLRLEVPAISSAGDIEIAWQAGVGILAESYPDARDYVVRLADAEGRPLVEFEARGRGARVLVRKADASRLGEMTTVRYLVGGEPAMPEGAVAISEGDGSGLASAGYLDAKNRAAFARSISDRRPSAFARAGRAEATKTRSAVPARPAPTPDQDAGGLLARELTVLLERPAAGSIEGADALRALAISSAPSGPERVLDLRRWVAVVSATTAERPLGNVIGAAASTARAVGDTQLPELGQYRDSRFSEAVLVAAGSPDAPTQMRSLASFLRGKRWDIDPAKRSLADTPTVPGLGRIDDQAAAVREYADRLALESRGDGRAPVVSWETSVGPTTLAPTSWLAYVRADGCAYWRLGVDGAAALRDVSLVGWAWESRRIAVVDSADVGRVLSTIEVR